MHSTRTSNGQSDAPSFPSRIFPTPIEVVLLLFGLALVYRYAWLMDDAFVYFRYVDNFTILKIGLVYNQGEFVEGYSSPIWVLLLSLFRWVGVDPWYAVLVVAGLSWLAFWGLLVLLERSWSVASIHKILPKGQRGLRRSLNLPLILLSLNYGVLCYFTSGLETPLVQVIAVAFCLFAFSPNSLPLASAVAIAPLIRQELLLSTALAIGWSWYRTKKFPAMLFLLSVVFAGGWFLFRIYYYADLFPNTYYLKDTISIVQGLIYVHDTAAPYHLYFILALFAACGFFIWRTNGSIPNFAERLVMLACALPILLYVVKIGGDPRHYRYLAFPLCLTLCACGQLLERAGSVFASRFQQGWFVPQAIAGALALFTFFSFPRQLNVHPLLLTSDEHNVDHIRDANAHRRKLDLRYSGWREIASVERQRAFLGATRAAHNSFQYAKIRSDWWCANAYRQFDTRIVHSLGLTDPILARMNMRVSRTAHRWGLLPKAREMVSILRTDLNLTPGLYRRAVERGAAPTWVRDNLPSIELIERKMFNSHQWSENFWLAITRVPRIEP